MNDVQDGAVDCFCGRDMRAEALICLFEEIAHEEGWSPGTKLRTYRNQSVYFALHNCSQQIGGIQIVLAQTADWWPSRTIWPECNPANQNGVAHVLIMAVKEDYRGRGECLLRLCINLWQFCAIQGIDELRLECTPKTHRIYQRLGIPVEVIGPPRIHWGELCLPAKLSLKEVAVASTRKAEQSSRYRALITQLMEL